MDVKSKARAFAIKAHGGQVRKVEKEKPYIFHSIDVALKLERFGFDDNVVAAGYLHDVIEDTSYTKEDILKLFGSDICSLVIGASEENKSLSWEERKIRSINRVKNLDLRHKAIVVCDKISNMEDLRYKFGKIGREDYSSFNRGKNKKIWYWNEVYKSLIYGEDENLPMFLELKSNIDCVSNMKKIIDEGYYPDIDVFDKNLEISEKARVLYYKKLELLKIKSLFNNYGTYIVAFTGDKLLKKDLIDKLKTYLILSGFYVMTNDSSKLKDKCDIILLDSLNLDDALRDEINLIINLDLFLVGNNMLDICEYIMDRMRISYLTLAKNNGYLKKRYIKNKRTFK